MSETERRETAQRHAGEVVEGSGQPAGPRRLGEMVSVRLEPALAAALRDVASRKCTTVSDLLRDAAVEAVAAEGYCRSCLGRR